MDRQGIRRTTLRLAVVFAFLLLAGTTFQGIATAVERRQFPRPGGMVDAGGHQLHIYCIGEGAPTVVLEAPALGMSAAWGSVQPQIARVTRVCSYDRTGLGWSEDGDGPYDPGNAAEELHTVLARASEPPPFVVAGHGLGAAFATLFASRYGDETPALILIDVPEAGQEPGDADLLVEHPGVLPWLARTGALRLTRALSGSVEGLPQPSRSVLSAFLNRPDHLSRAARELRYWDDVTARAAAIAPSQHTIVTRLDVLGRGRLAFLPESHAAPVVGAVLAAIGAVRQTHRTR
jgi:pimeloyl-ACP methyl ester carboxylesterase